MSNPARRVPEAITRTQSEINAAPLRDVMLVLLIIFMVVTPMITPGVDVQVPEAANPRERTAHDGTPVVSLRGDGTVFLNDDEIEPSRLFEDVETLLAARAEKTLFLKANERLDYARVLETMDLCRRAGALEVALVTRDKRP